MDFFSERGMTAVLPIEMWYPPVSVSREYLLCLLDQRMLVPAACKSQTFWQVESPEQHSLDELAATPGNTQIGFLLQVGSTTDLVILWSLVFNFSTKGLLVVVF